MSDQFGLEAGDAGLLAAIEVLRQPVAANRGVDRALRRLDQERRRRTTWRWAAVAVLTLAVGIGAWNAHRATRPVHFAIRSAEARRVALVGDFNDWDRSDVHLERRGAVWSVTLRLPPGRYRYSFLADGTRWISDGPNPSSDDDFNTPTQVVTVAN